MHLDHLQNEDKQVDRLVQFIKSVYGYFKIDEGSTSYPRTLNGLLVKVALGALGVLTLWYGSGIGSNEWKGLLRLKIGIIVSCFCIIACFIAPLIELYVS